eukprot:158217_1
MYHPVKQLSQQNYRMINIHGNVNNHSQVTEHLDGANMKAAPLPTIDEDQISTYSDTSITLSSLSDTSIITSSPYPSMTPPITFLTQFIPNIPFNTPPLSNYNLLNLHWGSANNFTVYPNQPI